MGTILGIIGWAFQLYTYALIIYIFMSWFPGARESQFGQILAKICEPYLEVFRKFIPPLGMIDFSPIIAIFALQLALSGLREVLSWIFF